MVRYGARLLLVLMLTLAACAGPPAEPRSERADRPAEQDLATGGATASEPRIEVASTTSETPLLAVGDVGDCTTNKDEKVAGVVRARGGKVALLGDIAYDNGSPTEFNECFDPAWGPMFNRLKPATGNHDYYTDGAVGYFGYFGDKAGEAPNGWYSYDVGPHWRAIVLNSNCSKVGGCQAESPQGKFLASEIAAAKAANRHILAYWHAPLYSSGDHGPAKRMRPFFSMLYKARAPIVLSGHDHSYERFRPQNALGDYRARGVVQFVVGTGGRYLYPFERPRHPNTRVRNAKTFGVLRLVLRPDSYSWRFVRAAGSTTFSDRGTRNL